MKYIIETISDVELSPETVLEFVRRVIVKPEELISGRSVLFYVSTDKELNKGFVVHEILRKSGTRKFVVQKL